MSARVVGWPRLLILLVLSALVAMTWLFMEQWQQGMFAKAQSPGTPDAAEAMPAENRAPLVNTQQVIDGYEEFVGRPLFISTRRPVPPEEAEASAVEPEAALPDLSGVRLTSIVVTSAGPAAWFTTGAGDETLQLAPGDTLLSWTLHAIESDHVILTMQDARRRIDLRPAVPAAPAAPPPRPVGRIPRRRVR